MIDGADKASDPSKETALLPPADLFFRGSPALVHKEICQIGAPEPSEEQKAGIFQLS